MQKLHPSPQLHVSTADSRTIDRAVYHIFVVPSSLAVLQHKTADLGHRLQPRVQSVARDAQVRLAELVAFGPAQRRVPQALLNDGVEPGQQEVQTGTFTRSLETREKFA